MNDYCNEIIEKLNEGILELTGENANSLILYEKAINLVLKQIKRMDLKLQELCLIMELR
mgnify:CR=1 FL=1